MPVVRFPYSLRRKPSVSGQIAKQRLDFKLPGALVRFPGLLNDAVTTNPELFLPVLLLFVWQASAISVKPRALGLALVLTLVLLIYAYRVLGTTPWLRRLSWVAPRQGFWLYCVIAGAAASAAVWGMARLSHLSLGGGPPPNVLLLSRPHPARSWRRCSFEASSSGRCSSFLPAVVLPNRPPAQQRSCLWPSVSLSLTLTGPG